LKALGTEGDELFDSAMTWPMVVQLERVVCSINEAIDHSKTKSAHASSVCLLSPATWHSCFAGSQQWRAVVLGAPYATNPAYQEQRESEKSKRAFAKSQKIIK
jgi:hypothetical protein